MSKQEDLINELQNIKDKTLSDEGLAKRLNMSIKGVQDIVHIILKNEKKYKNFSIIKHGKRKNLSRELVSSDTEENNILRDRDKHLTKGLVQFSISTKLGKIGLATRQSIMNRNLLLSNVLEQNLRFTIQAQEILQR